MSRWLLEHIDSHAHLLLCPELEGVLSCRRTAEVADERRQLEGGRAGLLQGFSSALSLLGNGPGHVQTWCKQSFHPQRASSACVPLL